MSVINTNITSMIGQSNLNKSQNALQTSMERLSSGLRINSAKDDAAGQAIANRMTAQITGLAQAQRNANDGISVAQTAEGALNQVNDNLQRIRELTVQAQNDTNSSNDLQSIQDEINQRLDEIDRISRETNFNGVEVLAQDRALNIQVGANDTQVIEVELQEINRDTLLLEGFTVAGDPAATVSDVERLLGQEITGRSFDVEGTTYNIDDEGAVTTAGGDPVFVDGVTGELTTQPGGGMEENDTITVGDYNTTEFTPASDGSNLEDLYEVFGIDASDIAAIGDDATETFEAEVDSQTVTLTVGKSSGTIDNVSLDETLYKRGDDSFTTSAVDLDALEAFGFDRDELEAAITAGNGTVTTNGDGGEEFTITFDAGLVGSFTSDTSGDVRISAADPTLLTTAQESEVPGNTAATLADVEGADDAELSSVTLGDLGSFEVEDGNLLSSGVRQFVSTNDDGDAILVNEADATERTSSPLRTLDDALNIVDSLRSQLGAVQNRFEDAITNLNTNETNLAAARSRIEDADYAVEVANMTRAQILQQAGTSVLAQANQIPQNVLSLLG